jgi:hypothetical protein
VHGADRWQTGPLLSAADWFDRRLKSSHHIERIGATEAGREMQKAWLHLEVVQCGSCQIRPGLSTDVLYGVVAAREKAARSKQSSSTHSGSKPVDGRMREHQSFAGGGPTDQTDLSGCSRSFGRKRSFDAQ